MIEYDAIEFWVTNGYFKVGKEAILSIDLRDITLNLQKDFYKARLCRSYKAQQSDIFISDETKIISCSGRFTGYSLAQILETNKIHAASFYLNNDPVLQIEIHDLGNELQTQEIEIGDTCHVSTILNKCGY